MAHHDPTIVERLQSETTTRALRRARLLAKEHSVEVWDGNRLITTIEPHPEH
jgi:hypothetical protein